MPGICTSEIKHAVLETQSEFRNSPADVNVRALNPKASTRSFVASQIMTSLSTIAIRGASLIQYSPFVHTRWAPEQARIHDQSRGWAKQIAWPPSESFISPCGFPRQPLRLALT